MRGRVGRGDKEAHAHLFYLDKSLLIYQALVCFFLWDLYKSFTVLCWNYWPYYNQSCWLFKSSVFSLVSSMFNTIPTVELTWPWFIHITSHDHCWLFVNSYKHKFSYRFQKVRRKSIIYFSNLQNKDLIVWKKSQTGNKKPRQ